jgi:hypothetical protein
MKAHEWKILFNLFVNIPSRLPFSLSSDMAKSKYVIGARSGHLLMRRWNVLTSRCGENMRDEYNHGGVGICCLP